MKTPSEHAIKAAESICNYCSTRFPTSEPPCKQLDVPWFAEKVQIAIDKREAERMTEFADILRRMDELADIWGDEGVFRRLRDRMREIANA